MINKKNISIKVIYEFGELINCFGQYEYNDIQKLFYAALKENLFNLSYLELNKDTYFNSPQCKDIKKELKMLNNYNKLNKNLLNSIEKAADLSIKERAFIKFEISK